MLLKGHEDELGIDRINSYSKIELTTRTRTNKEKPVEENYLELNTTGQLVLQKSTGRVELNAPWLQFVIVKNAVVSE